MEQAIKKCVLNVGQCLPDHWAMRRMLERAFRADVVQADTAEETLSQLRGRAFDLVLVNRKLDADYSDGLEIIKAIKADPDLSATPVMLVTNFPEYDAAAVAEGAEAGFGKDHLHNPRTQERLRKFLT